MSLLTFQKSDVVTLKIYNKLIHSDENWNKVLLNEIHARTLIALCRNSHKESEGIEVRESELMQFPFLALLCVLLLLFTS